MVSAQATIINPLGLHARAAAKFVQLAAQYNSQVWLIAEGVTADAKSILGVLTLAACKGTAVTIQAEGDDEQDALAALMALIEEGFGEL